MSHLKPLTVILAVMSAGGVLTAAAETEAREPASIVTTRSAGGPAAIRGRRVEREPGQTHVTRGYATSYGRGVRRDRTTQWDDNSLHNQVSRRYRSGASASRESSVVRNPDGSISTNRSHAGVAGGAQNAWSTIYRTDDGYLRTRGAETSNGRGYEAQREVSVDDDAITINHSATTNSGRAVTSSRTVPRPR